MPIHRDLTAEEEERLEEAERAEEAEEAARWAAEAAEVAACLVELAAGRCARLGALLGRREQEEAELRAKLAIEAAFDDTAEGERLHRYQARWGRALLRTLAMVQQLRDDGEEGMSHGCTQMDTDQAGSQGTPEPGEAAGCEGPVSDLATEGDQLSGVKEGTWEAGPDLGGGEPGAATAADPGPAPRREKSVQNKATADASAVGGKGSHVEGTVEARATMARNLGPDSAERGSTMRPRRWWQS
jgi:hypothetical protein